MSMRLGLVALIWLFILGGALVFMYVESPTAMVQVPQFERIAGDFALEVTTSFPLEQDPFALTVDSEEQAALSVTFDGQTLFTTSELPAHTPRRVEPLPDLMQGANEFLVTATPPLSGGQSYAVRLRLLQGETPLADETFWAAGGASVTGALRVDTDTLQEQHAN